MFTLTRAMRNPVDSSRGRVHASAGMLTATAGLTPALPAFAGYTNTGLYALFGLLPTRRFSRL